MLPPSDRSQKLLEENAELAARLKILERISAQRLEENGRLKEQLARVTERATLLEEEARWLKAQFFGRSSERSSADVSADQKRLFNEAEVLAAIAAAEDAHAQKTTSIEAHERKRRGHRMAIPEHFLRHEIVHDLPAHEKVCPYDHTALVRFPPCGPPCSGRCSATSRSSTPAAAANGLEPHGYLLQLFERLPAARTVEDLEALLPWNVKAQLKQAA